MAIALFQTSMANVLFRAKRWKTQLYRGHIIKAKAVRNIANFWVGIARVRYSEDGRFRDEEILAPRAFPTKEEAERYIAHTLKVWVDKRIAEGSSRISLVSQD
jgi:hypothetical protein